MALQGISVGGTVYRYDYNYLDNKPALGDFLPEVTSSDAGKVLQVDNSGNWGASSGGSGSNGVTFTPSVDSSGNLSWTNDGNLSNPETVNIKGADATINGVNALTIAAGNNVTLSQSGSTLTINSSGAINDIKVNDFYAPITNKTASLTIPYDTSYFLSRNGAKFQTYDDVVSLINQRTLRMYKLGGSVTFANLPALTPACNGLVVNVTDAFTTTSDFIEGAGKSYPAGTNVAVVYTNPIIDFGDCWDQYDYRDGAWVFTNNGQLFVYGSGDWEMLEDGYAWYDYYNQITSVIIPNGAISLGFYAFGQSSNITSVYLPTSIENIDTGAFSEATYNDSSIDVYYAGTQAQWEAVAFDEGESEPPSSWTVHYSSPQPSQFKYNVLSGFIDVQSLQAENALLRELIRGIDAPAYRTASGNPVTFSDGYAANVRRLSVTITPTQSGTPSVENPVAITGVSAVSVTRTGENGANSQTVTVSLTDGNNALTVYGGTLNVTTGELIVTHGSVSSYDGVTAVPDGWISSTGQLSAGAQIIYPLAAADYQSYTLTGQNLSALYGENTFSANAGSVTVEYRADVTLSLPTSS